MIGILNQLKIHALTWLEDPRHIDRLPLWTVKYILMSQGLFGLVMSRKIDAAGKELDSLRSELDAEIKAAKDRAGHTHPAINKDRGEQS
ncbi:hypothetical protein [Thiocystis violascens]|uniref:Uncharacterized protein n=1 Tax=Thiocystis violascens (strain ATCC 17096 / DSM 198 / 6111) TaxID=765911 RepID=I3YBE4_THIV6|nr:hypothetical protein [Thiocystis violascens]AFL74312.1 hypothetical protein Thivi_2367 [Thiocystis violascens DSM 198]